MAVPLATVAIDVVLGLNAGNPGAYSATVLDPRWNTSQVVDAILTSDAAVVAATMKNKDSARAALYYTTQAGLAHGGTIGLTAGPIASVVFVVTGGTAPGSRPGTEWEPAEIQREIVNALGLDYDPHYDIDGRVIYHNGTAIAAQSGGGSVSVNITYPAFSRTSACQAAEEFQWAVFCGAMALLVPVEGENVGAMGSWAQLFEVALQGIMSGDITQAREAVAQRQAA